MKLGILTGGILLGLCAGLAGAEKALFEIRFTDRESGRGIPLVELTTVHDVRYVTDNAGRIAYREPGQAGREIYFHVRAQGYEVPKDGFGFAGIRIRIEPGASTSISLKRLNLAERLYRCTGEDRYRDSLLLGHRSPLREPRASGRVAGQDSVQASVYRGRIRWFWGDTNRLSYPLGLFRTAGAVSDLPGQGGLPPDEGIDYRYFTGEGGFARAMAETPLPDGVVWVDGLCTLTDAEGGEQLVAHFSRRRDLATELEHGFLLYDNETERFGVSATLPLEERWRHLAHHPVTVDDARFLAFGAPFPVTRVPNSIGAVFDPGSYEGFSCQRDPGSGAPRRNEDGGLEWGWGSSLPVTQKEERDWLQKGLIKPGEARFLPVDSADPQRHVLLHHGTVRWNPWRKRWVMIATESATTKDSPSFLGEVWYAEAESAQGPWEKAVRVVTHDKQTFYNPCHHAFFDQEGGRVIYFEGTYCNTFTDSAPTPRYNYNQVMYRLDLDHPVLRKEFPRNR